MADPLTPEMASLNITGLHTILHDLMRILPHIHIPRFAVVRQRRHQQERALRPCSAALPLPLLAEPLSGPELMPALATGLIRQAPGPGPSLWAPAHGADVRGTERAGPPDSSGRLISA